MKLKQYLTIKRGTPKTSQVKSTLGVILPYIDLQRTKTSKEKPKLRLIK